MIWTVIGSLITTTRFITDTQPSYIHARYHCVYYCCCMPFMGCSDAIQTVKNLRYGPVQRLRSPVYLLPRLRTIRFRHTLSSHHWFHISTSDTLNCTTLPQQRHPVRSASVVRGGQFLPSYYFNNSNDWPIYLSNSLNNQAHFIWRG